MMAGTDASIRYGSTLCSELESSSQCCARFLEEIVKPLWHKASSEDC